MSCVKLVILFALFSAVLSAVQTNKPEKHQKIDKVLLKELLNKDCVNSYSFTCFKLDIASWVDKFDRSEDLKILPGFSLVKEDAIGGETQEQIINDLAREFPDDPDARLNAYLMRKVTGFFDTHSIKMNLLNAVEGVQGEARKKGGGFGGGGGGGKGGGGLGLILAAGGMMKGMLLTLGMGSIAAIASKAIMTSLISLVISAVIGLKALTHHEGHDSYKVIKAEPVYEAHDFEHVGAHERVSYARSLDDKPLPVALRPGYKPIP